MIILITGASHTGKTALAQKLLEKVLKVDIDNNFAYSHYLGLIYTHLKSDRLPEATELFDRIPISNAITDLDEWEQPLWISISFETLYPIIFETIIWAIFIRKTHKPLSCCGG